jgi:hypothetical protein
VAQQARAHERQIVEVPIESEAVRPATPLLQEIEEGEQRQDARRGEKHGKALAQPADHALSRGSGVGPCAAHVVQTHRDQEHAEGGVEHVEQQKEEPGEPYAVRAATKRSEHMAAKEDQQDCRAHEDDERVVAHLSKMQDERYRIRK